MTCRKRRDDVEAAGESLLRDELWRCLFTDRSGIRHEGGLSLRKRRLSGTWEPGTPMRTEKPQVEEPRG